MKKIFLEPREKKVSKEALAQLSKLDYEKIGLLFSVQHLEQMKKVEKKLKELGKEIHKAEGNLTKYKGQILGCDISAASKIEERIDCFLYVGTGVFHPLPVAMEFEKPVFIFNPYQGLERLGEDEVSRYRRKVRLNLEKVKNSDKIGILISNKSGQENKKLAVKLKRKLEAKGKQAYLFYFNTLNPRTLRNFPKIEAWVNTACPRIALEDLDRFRRPVINARRLMENGI